MISWNGFVGCVAVAALNAVVACLLLHRFWQRRLLALKQELAQLSADLMEMADLQSDIYRQVSCNLSNIEGKVLDLSVPVSEGVLPLEKRHQVLTLARRGVGVDAIAHRLGMPRGEVDLILNVRKFAKTAAHPQRPKGAIQEYARASS